MCLLVWHRRHGLNPRSVVKSVQANTSMMRTMALFSVFASILMSVTLAVRIIDNGIDTRIIATDDAHCNSGRIEFFDGTKWGSYSDCSHSITMDIATSFCQSLGWDNASSFSLGPESPPDTNITFTESVFIAYTDIYCPPTESYNGNICDGTSMDYNDSLADICVDCQFTNHLQSHCPRNVSFSEIHSNFDVYITCSNECDENQTSSRLFDCADYAVTDIMDIYYGEVWSDKHFGSCADSFDGDEDQELDDAWKLAVMVVSCVVILLAITAFLKHRKGHVKNRRFTEAYMMNLEDDGDVNMDSLHQPLHRDYLRNDE